ncbi:MULTISPECIES: COX15/CtaA family protein [Exiguobacterium]|uniref:Heme A synthase n=2 Tax=Exiguobacterium TaxID=33986 RepID=CTAA_EXISA|nr:MULTISPECIES: heme A synthase [Exiguobacterium]C4L5D6.1 RecName: Full=Heme A synthase; Short=HAS; AltName: Full=Cytochrome aa3-controlling protein [Exiguobacterium sp. AT1b]ACQ71721.1 cytochrome oxidase assembly [Exiguobacterium sp. AT1b]MBQ6460303.1 heme A synthase [Exiguobacterium sp.]MCM3279253.1 heme A synthase [Exiguobacterium sp. MER 193]MDX5981013.1 heme A synthase [Exiguobacterium profundum]QUP86182.1 heme A synthase [Exiguobacterium sp. PFWT01]
MHKKLAFFSGFVTLGMMLVLIMGGTVTKTDSGDGCGTDWPLCHGKLIPTNPSVETMIEYSHRVVSGIEGLLIIALAIWTFIAVKHRVDVKIFAFLAFIFMLIQSIIGAGAVIWQQSDAILALHFGISLVSFASLLILTILLFEGDREHQVVSRRLRSHLYGLSIYTMIVVYTGAYVRHLGATYACVGWPICEQEVWTFESYVQMGHRVMAGLLVLYTLYVLYLARKEMNRLIERGMMASLFFILLQVGTGAWIVLGGHATYVPLLHAFLITCYFGILSYLSYHAYRSTARQDGAQLKNMNG